MNLKEQAAKMTQDEIAVMLSFNQDLQRESQSKEQEISLYKKQVCDLEQSNIKLKEHTEKLVHELEWYKQQLFGRKSEKRILAASPNQLALGEVLEVDEKPPEEKETIKQYERKKRKKEAFPGTPEDSGLRFNESVPVEEILVPNPDIEGLSEDEYEVLGEEVTYKLAQQPSSYVVLRYVKQKVKVKASGKISTSPAPPAVIEKSFADVSFLAGLLIDKFLYHLPLHRQHQRLLASGVKVSRVTLTNLVHRTAQLLEMVYNALFSSILQSQVIGMDETPIKAGRKVKGKMQKGYFWPICGDRDEIVFLFAASRAKKVVCEALLAYEGTLITDGYKVYERYAEANNKVTHAQCWAHTRRKFIEAEKVEPELVSTALDYIAKLYEHEASIKEAKLKPHQAQAYRTKHSKVVVNDFFAWLTGIFKIQDLLPSSLFGKAASYALNRERALRVFLDDPAVPIDTNHVERQIRPVAVGRKNWMFCWTELGARYTGIIQSIIASCRLQDVDPYTYLVDVLQRIDAHPAREVGQLTPRLWKKKFADNPMRSKLDRLRSQ